MLDEIQNQLRVVRLFDPYRQGAALAELQGDPKLISDADRRALATLAVTAPPDIKASAQQLLNIIA